MAEPITKAERDSIRSWRDEVRAKIGSYNGGDRPVSPPAYLLAREQGLGLAMRLLDALEAAEAEAEKMREAVRVVGEKADRAYDCHGAMCGACISCLHVTIEAHEAELALLRGHAGGGGDLLPCCVCGSTEPCEHDEDEPPMSEAVEAGGAE